MIRENIDEITAERFDAIDICLKPNITGKRFLFISDMLRNGLLFSDQHF